MGSYCTEYEGGNWISVIYSGDQPGARALQSEEVPLLDPTEGRVTNMEDMDLIARLKQCAVTSSSFSWWVAYQNVLSSMRPHLPTIPWHANDRCWNITMNLKRVIFLPLSLVQLTLYLAFALISFLAKMTLCAPCVALSGQRSIKVGKTRLSLRDRHTYQWGCHPWGEGPIEQHTHVAAQTFRIAVPPGSVPGQTISIKVPMGFAQSGQTRVIVVPPLGQTFVDVPLNAAVVLQTLPGQGQTLQAVVPEGMRGGQTLLVDTPSGRMQVVIPLGLKEGELFQFLVAAPS